MTEFSLVMYAGLLKYYCLLVWIIIQLLFLVWTGPTQVVQQMGYWYYIDLRNINLLVQQYRTIPVSAAFQILLHSL